MFRYYLYVLVFFFFFQAEDGIRDYKVTGVQTCALPISQSFFAIAVLVTLSISVREAWMLFGLFWAQFIVGAIVPESFMGIERVLVGTVYLVLGLVIFTRQRRLIRPLVRDGFRTSYRELYGREIVGE